MSGQASGWVLRCGPRPEMVDRNGKRYGQRARGLRAVLGTVADAANINGEHAHPGQEAICWGSLYGKSQALALVAELIAERWLAVEQQGGGRGLATVYCLPRMMEELAAERVQPSDGNEKPSDLVIETVRSKTETARSHSSGPADTREHGLSTVMTNGDASALLANPNGHANGKDIDHVTADAILNNWWEERKGAGNPVGQKWLACRGVIRSMVAQGVKPSRVAWGLRNSPVCSSAALELAIQKRIQDEAGPKRPPKPNPDAEWSEYSQAWVS